jgi:hypothetical protein
MSSKKNINYTPPSHQKGIGIIQFLQDKTLVEKFFDMYKKNYEGGFQIVLKKLNINPGLISVIKNNKDSGRLIDEKKEFFKRFEKLQKELKIFDDKRLMNEFKNRLKDHDFNYTKVLFSLKPPLFSPNKMKRLEEDYGFETEVKKLQLKNRDHKFNEYIQSSLKKYKTYIKLGISHNNSTRLSGFGVPYGSKLFDYLIEYPHILDEMNKHKPGPGSKGLDGLTETLKNRRKELRVLNRLKKRLLRKHGEIKLKSNPKTSYSVRVTSTQISFPPQPESEYYNIELGIKEVSKHIEELEKSVKNRQLTTKEKINRKKEKLRIQKESSLEWLSNNKPFQDRVIKHLNKNLEFGYFHRSEPIFNHNRGMKKFKFKGEIFEFEKIRRLLKYNLDFKNKVEKIQSQKKDLFEKRIRKEFLDLYKECRYVHEDVRRRKKEIRGYYRCRQDKKLIFKVNELRSQFIEEEFKKWFKESKIRFFDFVNQGFNYNDSLILSGIHQTYTKTRGKFYDIMRDDPDFNKRFMEIVVDTKNKTNTGIVNQDRVDKQKKYIEKLREFKDQLIKKNPKIFKGTTDSDFHFRYSVYLNISSKHRNSQPPPVYIFYLRRQIDVVIHQNTHFELNRLLKRFNENERKKNTFMKTLPKEWREQVRNVSRKGKSFMDVNGDVIFKHCPQCNTIKQSKDFSNRGKSGLQTWCTKCSRERSIRSGKSQGRVGEFYRGKRIKIFNELNQVVKKRCTSCTDFKPVKDFNYPQRKGSVCIECFIELPNNVLTRRGEFRKINGVNTRIREYDPISMKLIKKRCSTCEDLKPVEDFNTRNSGGRIDHYSGSCRNCNNERRRIYRSKKNVDSTK